MYTYGIHSNPFIENINLIICYVYAYIIILTFVEQYLGNKTLLRVY